MKILRLLAVLPLFALSLAAHADKLRLPADAPPAFQAECASCHLAFPPQLLAAEDWKRVMASLDKHYGDNASLDAKTRVILEDFLVRNAGKPEKSALAGRRHASLTPRPGSSASTTKCRAPTGRTPR